MIVLQVWNKVFFNKKVNYFLIEKNSIQAEKWMA